MDREDLEEYVEWASEIIEEKPQMNETNTREILIQEFIEVLDWSFRSLDIDGEYPVRMASRQTKVDYALMLDETPVVFVEVKGLDTKLNEDHREQITSYMHNEEGVNWGLLTNGEEYEFFMYDDSPSGFSLGAFELEELPEKFDVVRTLSKESVEAGESEERAEKLRERRRAVSRLRDEKEGIADDVTEAVTERVGESVTSVAETEAKEFVDRVVEELENGENGNSVRTSGEEQEKDEYDESDDIILIENKTTVASFNDDTQADTMAKAVRFLVEEKELLDNISIPYVPGDENAVLNDAPQHPDGRKMRAHRKITGDYYIDTHASKEQKERRLHGLTEKCDLSAEFNW